MVASVLSVIQLDTFPLRVDVRLQGSHLRIIRIESLAAHGIDDAPVDHIPQQCHTPHLCLKLGIGFRVRIGRVGMAHVA